MDNVSSVTIGLRVVEKVGVAVGIMVISHSVPEKHCISGFQSAILNCSTISTSDNVGSVTADMCVATNEGWLMEFRCCSDDF